MWIQELEKEVKEAMRILEEKYPQIEDMALVLKYGKEYSKDLPNMLIPDRDKAKGPADILEMSNILSAAHRNHIHTEYVELLQIHLNLVGQLQEHAEKYSEAKSPTDVGGELKGE